MTTKIITWLWSQPNSRFSYNTGHVNAWADAIRAHGCTLPIACVTDEPEGLHDWIEAIPMPRDFMGVKCSKWSEDAGLPQCYRRLAIYSKDAALWLKCDAVLQMDIDCIITGDLTPLTQRTEKLALFRGTSAKRPYNGGMQWLVLGSHPEVYDDFSPQNASIASSLFVGSDQAWLAHKLGWDEVKITEAHGVYHYSGKFLREYPYGRPENMLVLFCPGVRKFFPDGTFHNADLEMIQKIGNYLHKKQKCPMAIVQGVQYFALKNFYCGQGLVRKGDPVSQPSLSQIKLGLIAIVSNVVPADDREKKVVKPDEVKARPRLLALQDAKGWAELIASHSCATIITSTNQAQPGDAVFVRMRCNGPEKEETLDAVKALTARGIKTLPTLREALWYDDKVAQYDVLKPWMPETWIFRKRIESSKFLDTATYPIINKTPGGASSSGVTLCRNKSAAKKLAADQIRETGVTYFQQFIKTDRDYRINLSGRYMYGLTRYNRSEDEPFASGSGKNSPINFDQIEQRQAGLLAAEIGKALGIDWACLDFVWTGSEMKVLEISCAWVAKSYEQCNLYYWDTRPAGKIGNDYFAEVGRILNG